MSVERSAPRLLPGDVISNVVSLGAFVIGGLLANLLIARIYGPGPTGLFNQTLAFFVVLGQLAVFGIHQTALRESSLCGRDDAPGLANALLRALAWPVVLTTLGGVLFSFAVPSLFQSENLDVALRLALLGLPSFALNKVLTNFSSGLGYYRTSGVVQAMRALLFVFFCLIWVAAGWNGERIVLALAASEIVISLGLLAVVARRVGLLDRGPGRFSPGALRAFGARVMPSIAVAELNTRIDVIALGLFAGASEVGVYSVAAWMIEGALQLPVAVRPMLNTRMAELLRLKDFSGLRRLVLIAGGAVASVMAVALGLLLVLYPRYGVAMLGDARYAAAFWPLVFLSVGAVAMSWASPFDMMLVQAGKLREQFLLKAGMATINVALALPGAALWGAEGVAAAYAVSLAAYGLLLRMLVRRSIGPAIG